MVYKILSVEENHNAAGKPWYAAEIEDRGNVKTISCFNFKPEVDKEYTGI